MIDQGIRYTEMSTGNDLEQIYPTHQEKSVSVPQLHHKHSMSKAILVYLEVSVSEQQHHHKHLMFSAMLEYQEMSESVHQLQQQRSMSMEMLSTMDSINLEATLVGIV